MAILNIGVLNLNKKYNRTVLNGVKRGGGGGGGDGGISNVVQLLRTSTMLS